MWDLHELARKPRAGWDLKEVRSLWERGGFGAAAAQCRGTSPQALGNSLSAGGSLVVALLQLLPRPWVSAICKFCGINKPSLCPEFLLFWLILRRDQHCFVLDDGEPTKTSRASRVLIWGLPAEISALGGELLFRGRLGQGFWRRK